MKKNKKTEPDKNFLEFIPERNESLTWKTDRNGTITLVIENTGFFNRLAQKVFLKPEHSYVHLDELGTFVWPLIDGKTNIIELGKLVHEEFGEKAEPLYPRLAKYFQILESYNFIKLNKDV